MFHEVSYQIISREISMNIQQQKRHHLAVILYLNRFIMTTVTEYAKVFFYYQASSKYLKQKEHILIQHTTQN